jgi:hypothetical protein
MEVERITFPDEVLGGGIEGQRLPSGVAYGGADIWSARGKDGLLYVVLCVDSGPGIFGTYGFRSLPDGRAEWFSLPAFTETRVCVSEEWDGAYMTWPDQGARGILRAKVPGYVPPVAQPVPSQIPVVAVAPLGGSESADTTARSQITALTTRVKSLEAKLAGALSLNDRVGILERRPIVTIDSIKDTIWNTNTTIDKVWTDMQNTTSGLHTLVVSIIRTVLQEKKP